MGNYLEGFITLFRESGPLVSVFVAFFFLMHYWVYRLQKGRLDDKQQEIDRLVKSNREFQDRLIAIMDDRLGYKQPPTPVNRPTGTAKKGRGK